MEDFLKQIKAVVAKQYKIAIDSKDVQKFDNNFGIQNKNIEAFFNVEEM